MARIGIHEITRQVGYLCAVEASFWLMKKTVSLLGTDTKIA